MNQKLWMFENIKRSLGRAGMCWNQPTTVDLMCKTRWIRRRESFLARASLGYLRAASDEQ